MRKIYLKRSIAAMFILCCLSLTSVYADVTQDDINDAKNQVDNLKNQVEEAENERDEMQDKKDKLEGDLKNLNTNIRKIKTQKQIKQIINFHKYIKIFTIISIVDFKK